MAWVKRNLYFVITVAVGLGLTGFCGYLVYSAMNANAEASTAYATAKSGLEEMQKSTPYPSKENIEAAEKDAVRVKAFLAEFKKPFSGFPSPPKVDDRQFNDYLQHSIAQFGLEATNSGVSLPPDFAFGFSQQIGGKLNFASECIPPWMQELEEIKAILHIFCKAKINYLEQIKRPSASPDDLGPDIIQFQTNVAPWGVTSPYMVTFRAFSAEIANVLSGIAASSNCLIIKAVYVSPSRVPLPPINDQSDQAPAPPPVRFIPRPQQRNVDPNDPIMQQENSMRREREMRMERRPPIQPPPDAAPVPAGPTPPETILRETPLFVTIYIDVVKLKSDAPPAAAPAKPTRTPTPGTR